MRNNLLHSTFSSSQKAVAPKEGNNLLSMTTEGKQEGPQIAVRQHYNTLEKAF